jgi:phage tail-like protein
MPSGSKSDVYTTYRFWVEIDGITEAAFSECSGLQVETEVFEWQEGGLNDYVHRLPGRIKFSNITLKRGIAGAALWEWYCGNFEGQIKRRTLSIVLGGYAGATPVRWNIVGALPIKWTGPTLKADANETAVETIELAHHGFKRV